MIEEHEEEYKYTKEMPSGYQPKMVLVDPELTRVERGTLITFNDAEGYAEVTSYQKTVIRYLMEHKSFQVDEITWSGGNIVGVLGKIPKTCILITSKPRQKFSGGFRRRGRK